MLLYFSPSETGLSYFRNSLIFVCQHSKEGALGLIINRTMNLELNVLLDGIGIQNSNSIKHDNIHIGGPVNTGSLFILHTLEDLKESDLKVNNNIQLSSSTDILERIVAGRGPDKYLIALGYCGWTAGQLDDEIADNAWIPIPGDSDIIFNMESKDKIRAASKIMGFNLEMISPDHGNA